MDWLTSPEAWVALASLTALEIVLGVDNIIFISILVGRLPEQERQKARIVGLGLAMVARIGLLLSLAWMMRLSDPLFAVAGVDVTGRTLILFGGGLFLLAKSVLEIHSALEGAEAHDRPASGQPSLAGTLAQIAVIDIVFSLDSVITAVGMARDIVVMVAAIVIAVVVMMFAARPIGEFVDGHPTFKMLALAFLILVGVALVGEGLGMHIPKGYIYFAMAFSLAVEMLNLKLRRKRKPVKLRSKALKRTRSR